MEKKCNCSKKKIRSKEDKNKLIHRLNRIEGQVRGICKMVENDSYCVDILTQSAAVSAAVNAFNKELLSNHIYSCFVEDIKNGKYEAVDELTGLIKKLMK